MMEQTTGKTVAIIGGTSGIGLATAQLLLQKGYRVAIAGRDQTQLAEAIKALGDNAQGSAFDAADPAALQAFFSSYGPVDHVVITAANHGGAKPFADITAGDIETGVHGKLLVHVAAAQAAVKALRPGGSITFISAITATTPLPGTAVLAAINGAIASMVPTIAAELAPIRVNAVLPGTIDTAWWDWLPEEARKGVFEQSAKTAPVGRVGQPADIADAIAFLLGNSFTTGVLLPCDGGLHVVPGKN